MLFRSVSQSRYSANSYQNVIDDVRAVQPAAAQTAAVQPAAAQPAAAQPAAAQSAAQ